MLNENKILKIISALYSCINIKKIILSEMTVINNNMKNKKVDMLCDNLDKNVLRRHCFFIWILRSQSNGESKFLSSGHLRPHASNRISVTSK